MRFMRLRLLYSTVGVALAAPSVHAEANLYDRKSLTASTAAPPPTKYLQLKAVSVRFNMNTVTTISKANRETTEYFFIQDFGN